MVDLGDLIHVYDGVLDEKTCDFLIKVFDEESEHHEVIENEGRPNFTQFNLTENCNFTDELKKVHNSVTKKVQKYQKEYFSVFPNKR